MGNTEEIDLLKSRMKLLEDKLNHVEGFISTRAELVAEQKRFLEKEESILQTFISGLKSKETVEYEASETSEGDGEVDVDVEVQDENETNATSPSPSTFEPSSPEIPENNGDVESESQSDSLQAPVQYTSVILYQEDPSREQSQDEDRRQASPTRIHCQRQDSSPTRQASPPKVVQTVQSKVYTPPVQVLPGITDKSRTPSPSQRRFPKRIMKRPLRYGQNLYNRHYLPGSPKRASVENEMDANESEPLPTENPLLALGLIPKVVDVDETCSENPEFSPDEVKVEVEEVEMPILEEAQQMEPHTSESSQQFESRGVMPTLAAVVDSHIDAYDDPNAKRFGHSVIVQNPGRALESISESAIDKEYESISAKNNWPIRGKPNSRRGEQDGSKTRKPRALSDKSPHICTICGQKLRSLHGLKAHITSHSGVKPFQCNRCDARFSQKSSLNRHILVHTGEKKFICQSCDKGFITRYDLLIHSRVHSRKAQACPACAKIFFDPRYFSGHVKACTSDVLNKCPKCEKVLKDPKYLRKHIEMCEQKQTQQTSKKEVSRKSDGL